MLRELFKEINAVCFFKNPLLTLESETRMIAQEIKDRGRTDLTDPWKNFLKRIMEIIALDLLYSGESPPKL